MTIKFLLTKILMVHFIKLNGFTLKIFMNCKQMIHIFSQKFSYSLQTGTYEGVPFIEGTFIYNCKSA